MGDFLIVLGLSSLPAVGNFFGGLLSEWLNPSRNFVNRALHAAAGIILAVVSVEVMPSALAIVPVCQNGKKCGLVCLASSSQNAFTILENGSINDILESFNKNLIKRMPAAAI